MKIYIRRGNEIERDRERGEREWLYIVFQINTGERGVEGGCNHNNIS